MYIVLAILIFGFLIATHELGHFLAAKAFGVKVEEFAVGMGPAIVKRRKGETLYSWRCLPIGGYCAMNEDDGDSEDGRAFVNQAWWKRLIILCMGAFMNFLTGIIVLMFIVPKSNSFIAPTIAEFFDGCPYVGEEKLMPGDTFYKIDGSRVYFSSNVAMLLQRGKDDIHDIVIIRDGEKIEYDDFQLSLVDYDIDGVTQQKYGFVFDVDNDRTFWENARNTWYCSKDFVRMVWMGLSDLITGAVGLKELSGPVGIVSLINDVGETSESVSAAMFSIFYLAAFIAINLAVMNMLPFPALDGGRILFLLVNAFVLGVFRRKLNPKYEAYVHTGGLVLLLGLMAVVMVSDIYKLFL